MKQVVLMYHCVYGDSPKESGFQNTTAFPYKISAEQFERQVITIADYLVKKGLPKTAVEFTFDDGGVSFFTVIKPILEKYGFRGIFFVATKYIGTSGFMNAEQIKALEQAGHIVGSHSHSHPERMDVLSVDDIDKEWKLSRDILKQILNSNVDTASIPNGYSSYAVIDSMNKAGYKRIYTSKPSTKIVYRDGVSIVGRYAITCDMSTDFVFGIVSSRKTRIKIEMRNAVLGIAKVILGDFYLVIRKKLLSKK